MRASEKKKQGWWGERERESREKKGLRKKERKNRGFSAARVGNNINRSSGSSVFLLLSLLFLPPKLNLIAMASIKNIHGALGTDSLLLSSHQVFIQGQRGCQRRRNQGWVSKVAAFTCLSSFVPFSLSLPHSTVHGLVTLAPLLFLVSCLGAYLNPLIRLFRDIYICCCWCIVAASTIATVCHPARAWVTRLKQACSCRLNT